MPQVGRAHRWRGRKQRKVRRSRARERGARAAAGDGRGCGQGRACGSARRGCQQEEATPPPIGNHKSSLVSGSGGTWKPPLPHTSRRLRLRLSLGRVSPRSSSVAMTAAAARVFPKWVLLEPYVFRGDDDKSFPDDTVAPIRASGTTSWGAGFRIAFTLADPPSISRLYAQLPGFRSPVEEKPLHLVATHRHLAVINITTTTLSEGLVQNYFIFKVNKINPSSSSLTALPPCTERRYDFSGDLRRRRRHSNATPRLLDLRSSGLWCGDKGEEFVVAELTLYVASRGLNLLNVFADICLLRSSLTDGQLGGNQWNTMRVPILSTTEDDLWKLSHWHTNAAIPFQRWLCWIDYRQGIFFWDVSEKAPAPTVSFLWFPPDMYSLNSISKTLCSGNGGVSIIDQGHTLKFVYVARLDSGPCYGALKPGTGFTITCHTLVLGSSMAWKEDYTVTSDELPERFQQGLPMFPRVDIDTPEVVHFLFIELPSGKAYKKMSVLSIDMNKKAVVSFYLYMDGNEPPLPTEDVHFVNRNCLTLTPMPFIPCEFPRFCYLSSKRRRIRI